MSIDSKRTKLIDSCSKQKPQQRHMNAIYQRMQHVHHMQRHSCCTASLHEKKNTLNESHDADRHVTRRGGGGLTKSSPRHETRLRAHTSAPYIRMCRNTKTQKMHTVHVDTQIDDLDISSTLEDVTDPGSQTLQKAHQIMRRRRRAKRDLTFSHSE